jgi:hypothetical protein
LSSSFCIEEVESFISVEKEEGREGVESEGAIGGPRTCKTGCEEPEREGRECNCSGI